MPQLLIKSGAHVAQTVDLARGVTRIGRSPANDYCLDDATISGRHCEVVFENDMVRVRDLGSTNGTFIDGRPIEEAVLQTGQTLRLGSVETVLENPPPEIVIPALRSEPASPVLPGGVRACFNHADSPATMKCVQCDKVFCGPCVHQIRRVGGKALRLCPVCGGQCHSIMAGKPEKKRISRVTSWLGKVTAKMTGRVSRADEP